MKQQLFKDVEIDEGTVILNESVHQIDGLNIKHEKWRWDGVKADSFIFLSSETTNHADSDIKKLVSINFPKVDHSSFTTQIKDQYRFFNCNFSTV